MPEADPPLAEKQPRHSSGCFVFILRYLQRGRLSNEAECPEHIEGFKPLYARHKKNGPPEMGGFCFYNDGYLDPDAHFIEKPCTLPSSSNV